MAEIIEFPISLSLCVENAGLYLSRGVGLHPDRIIKSYELIFVREGTLSMEEEGRQLIISAGQSLILRPGLRHRGIATYPNNLAFYWIHFRLAEIADQKTLLVLQHTLVARPDYLTELFLRFMDDQETGILQPLSATLLVLQMLQELAYSRDLPKPELVNSAATVLATRAETYVTQHFHTTLSASKIAEELGCNADYLSRVYRKVMGRTLTDGIHRRRLLHAGKLLRETNKYVDQIAHDCGFEDVAYFRRIFKRHHGITPLAYRRLYAQMHVNTE